MENKQTSDTYAEDLAGMLATQARHGGYVYESVTGNVMWSREAMTADELQEHWAYVDANSAYIEAHSEEYDYEPYYTLGEPRINWSI